ncbi:MAG: MFS transporter [Hyphomicrobiaceae bacterium]
MHNTPTASYPGKHAAITLLAVSQTLAMSLWFSSSAVIGEMTAETEISPVRQAMLASGVQFGFAVGAIIYAILGLADRYDPRRVLATSAAIAALANLSLLASPIGSFEAILARILTGALLAGVYPVGMKIVVGWGQNDRGMLVGLLVGALTLGSAAPHLLAFLGGTDWRLTVAGASGLAFLGAAIGLLVGLGPHHARAHAFDPFAIVLAWKDQRIRLAYAGYLGHMWELYAFWAWIGAALTVAFSTHMAKTDATTLAKLTAFGVIGLGAFSSLAAGILADRIGKAETTIIAMIGSGSAAIAAAATFSFAPTLLIIVALLWGACVIADSAQFSALVADFAPPERAGTLLTLQTALGFALTIATVQSAPLAAEWLGWPALFLILAIGPAFGTAAMARLVRLQRSSQPER